MPMRWGQSRNLVYSVLKQKVEPTMSLSNYGIHPNSPVYFPGMIPQRSWLQRIVNGLVLVYVALMLLYIGNRFIIQDRIWLVSLFNTFSVVVFAPLPVLLLLSLIVRSRRSLLLLLPVTIWALVWLGPRFLPKANVALAAGTPTLRVMTNNVSHFNIDPELVPALAESQSPDVIFLQEVQLSTQADSFAALNAAYPYQTAQDDEMRVDMYTAVNITYSRTPFLSSEQVDPQIPGIPVIYRNVIDLGGQPVALYNIHLISPGGGIRFTNRFNNYFIRYALAYDDTNRNRQVDALLDYLATEPLPYIIGGDFNTSDFSMTYNRLAAQMGDSFAEGGVGLGGTWPAARATRLPSFLPPLIRIDYLWRSTGLQTVSAWQGDFSGSDHLPVFAEFALQPQ